MTKETEAKEEHNEQPIFSVQRIYTKDISFENPNAPQVFGAAEQPKIDLNLGVNNRQVDEHLWEVSLKVSALARNTEDDKVIFEVEVEHAGLFLLKNIPDEHILRVLGVDCPTIIFPFTRQLVSQLTSDGGFMPLLLDPFNFAVAYQQRLEEQHTTH
ncbi:MAG: protein-export chaperone SecB [Zetaproteobacteria bacterium CG06_land_8_20_14_3_00_59_53]|nr:MAG: protein-export chaperone SecB [Zetaproteobacteria bacterium CG2_30_59_37]PIO88783.1 MAG: protein-export chaperone SecB [Zetaproteobacteria bacterium CG23_combo_of_CG06-09_8_20_14_all_59_86]PIQ64507.1 MAG: protein-export chaperone SecB [Zetaproteobacteria bacterium CG11_big_fil_rev_8_21_14_0_20_59_439]PIU70014.1 MAG: protein-export chaperone SecB [Zetaproteobacteria bacterium CG06_land_8_20_14_3_00_59_53]PIU97971.1 MAG: protein-export chaperone SecB [Zetaproteobacteria bacterium CG03_lan